MTTMLEKPLQLMFVSMFVTSVLMYVPVNSSVFSSRRNEVEVTAA